MNLRVLVIDDHTLFREGLQGLLRRRNIEVVAATGNGNEGLALAEEHKPDIVLLDMRMPNTDGITVLKQLLEHGMQMPIVILTTSSDERDLIEALRA
ncbi:MAG: response regulator transcription factor, partial [Gammaproteobacteria bacterium]|nr:response regulator transcription factor [Gammaproteobacteria bacterium]